MKIENLHEVANKIAKSDFFKKHGNRQHWVSGSSTIVYPITIWKDDNCIEIQVKNMHGIKAALDKLVNEFGEQVRTHYICKYDGSCPNVAKIYFK